MHCKPDWRQRRSSVRQAGLPDGLFLYQKSQFGQILADLGVVNVGLFYDHLEYLHPMGTNYGRLV
jgi:hypothetical protein